MVVALGNSRIATGVAPAAPALAPTPAITPAGAAPTQTTAKRSQCCTTPLTMTTRYVRIPLSASGSYPPPPRDLLERGGGGEGGGGPAGSPPPPPAGMKINASPSPPPASGSHTTHPGVQQAAPPTKVTTRGTQRMQPFFGIQIHDARQNTFRAQGPGRGIPLEGPSQGPAMSTPRAKGGRTCDTVQCACAPSQCPRGGGHGTQGCPRGGGGEGALSADCPTPKTKRGFTRH